MRHSRIFIFIAYFYFSSLGMTGLVAQSSVDHYSVSHGLSNSVVNTICQDKYGFIWIGTDDGLNRFDGYEFTRYRHIRTDSTSLPNSFIQIIHRDKKGRLWIGTKAGLSLYRPESDDFYNLLVGRFIEFLTEDADGNIICWVSGGTKKIDGEKLTESNIVLGKGSLGPGLNTMFGIGDGSIFTVNQERILQYKPEGYEIMHSLEAPKGEVFLNCTKPLADTTVFIATSRRLLEVEINEGIYIKAEIPLSFLKVPAISNAYIFYDSGGTIWLSSEGALYSRSKGEKTFKPVEFRVGKLIKSNLNIEVIEEDKYGNLWMGDYGNGILLKPIQKNTFLHFDHEPNNFESLGHSQIAAFAEAEDGIIWIGTWGGGLNFYNPETQKVGRYKFRNSDLNTEIFRGACFDNKGLLWLATNNHGVVSLNTHTGDYNEYHEQRGVTGSLPSDNLYSIFSIRGGEIWTGHNFGGGLGRFNPRSNDFDDFYRDTIDDIHIPKLFVRNLIEDAAGNLWFGTYDMGIYFFDMDSLSLQNINSISNPFSDFFLSNDVIYSILEDSRGLIWIGTMGGGVNILNPKNYHLWYLMEKDGLANDVVNGILEDEQGNMWISTNNGISRFSIPDFFYEDTVSVEYLSGFDYNPYFLNYDINDGLQNNEFKYASCLKSSTGEMYFGGISGFNVFHPDEIMINTREPDIILTGISLNNQRQLVGPGSVLSGYPDDLEKINLDYNQNFITFEFIALNYNNSRKNSYEYILEGLEDSWNKASGLLSATYMNLKPGSYTFRIRASNNDGLWTSESKDIEILIDPPLWGRLWFQLFLILFLLGMLFSFYSFRLQLIRQRARELEDRVERRTQQLRMANNELEKKKNEIEEMAGNMHRIDQQKLRFFTNISHEFRTPLTLIVGPVEKLLGRKELDEETRNPLSVVYRNSLRLLRLINELLDIRKLDTENMKIQVFNRDMGKFIKGLAALFDFHAKRRDIHLSISTPSEEVMVWFDGKLMEKVFYNLLSNAFKFTNDGGTIDVFLEKSNVDHEGMVRIVIQDDGQGISEKDQKLVFDRFYQVQKGKEGNMNSGTGIGLALCKEFVELHHGKILVEGAEGKGTAFSVFLPEGNSHFKTKQILTESDPYQGSGFYPVFDNEYMGNETFLQDDVNESSLPMVLVIDDNEDMLNYIKDILSGSFQVILASEGNSGIARAREKIPELIICDIMMPGMDGFELTSILKSEEPTSHIPIILLSAKASEEDRVYGLEKGADDYITKPFNSRILLAKLKTIIENRKKLKLLYKDEYGFDPRSFIQNSHGDKFVSRAIQILEDNLSNETFDTGEFASAMGLSRSQLYRKISATTDQSASEFIRSFRMRKAVELLLAGELNVSEVAYSVGFKSLSNFTRTFTTLFKLSPTQYIAKHRNK